MEKATFAAGCFWGIEEVFDRIKGVISTRVGYTGGHTVNPTYKMVCHSPTGHAEAVEVGFDPAEVSYANLLDAFWRAHNPTTLNRQGADIGSQYRSAIFFHTVEQQQAAIQSKEEAQKRFSNPIVTEILPASLFYEAEEYHQHYHKKQGGSCHR